MKIDSMIFNPFYEYIDFILPLTSLQWKNFDFNSNRIISYGSHVIEICVDPDKMNLLLESREKNSINANIRVIMKFCTTEIASVMSKNEVIMKDSFPKHLKITVNGELISLPPYLPYDRIRKDGRRHPRPLDITDAIICHDSLSSECIIEWQQECNDSEFHHFSVDLVRWKSIDELVDYLFAHNILAVTHSLELIKLRDNNFIDCQYDLLQLNDAMVSSLICPVSMLRIKIPIRGNHCSHLQCFDCATYLTMNFNKPIWKCPICNHNSIFSDLQIDDLVLRIIKDERSELMDDIVINELGQWQSLVNVEDNQLYYDIPDKYTQPNEELLVKSEMNDHMSIEILHHDQLLHNNEFVTNSNHNYSNIQCKSSPSVNSRNDLSSQNKEDLLHSENLINDSAEIEVSVQNENNDQNYQKLRSLTKRKLLEKYEKIKETKNKYNDKHHHEFVESGDVEGLCINTISKNNKKIVERIIKKPRSAKWGSQPVGRPRKDRMSQPPSTILKDITKAMIKAKYLRDIDKRKSTLSNKSMDTIEASIEAVINLEKPTKQYINIDLTAKEESKEGNGIEVFELSTIDADSDKKKKIFVRLIGNKEGIKSGNRKVGRPRKDQMAPPPVEVLNEITKERIKAKYLRRFASKCKPLITNK